MMTETQFDLFGGEPLVRRSKARFEVGPKSTQMTLFSGLDCLPDQMNLFADDGVPEELVAVEVAVKEPEPEKPMTKEVTLDIEKIVDEHDKRVLRFTLRDRMDGRILHEVKSKEVRKGCRSWSQSDLYAARRKVRDWCAKHDATIVDKPE